MNKYQKALDRLYSLKDGIRNAYPFTKFKKEFKYTEESLEKMINSDRNTLQELVDNPPLKFEELKENMWVWDDDLKKYAKICKIVGDEFVEQEYILKFTDDEIEMWQESRFYRREVQK